MCLALPAEVVAVDADTEMATVSLGGVRKSISTALLDDLAPGQFVLVHVGYALNIVSEEEAQATLEAMQEAGLIDAAVAGHFQEERP
jgi:hydrogenase expression/formation protein HypC